MSKKAKRQRLSSEKQPHKSVKTATHAELHETPRETARKILARRGLAFQRGRKPVPADAYHDLDHQLHALGVKSER